MIHFKIIFYICLVIPLHSYANKVKFSGCRGSGHGHFGFHVNGHIKGGAITVVKNMNLGTIRNQFGEVTFDWFGLKSKKVDIEALKRGIIIHKSRLANSDIKTLTYKNETCEVKKSKNNKWRIGNCLKNENAPISSYVRYDKKTKDVKYLSEYHLHEKISISEDEKNSIKNIIKNYPLLSSDYKTHFFKEFDLKVIESYKLDLSGTKYFNILVQREVLNKNGNKTVKRIVGFKANFLKRNNILKLVATTAMDPVSGYTDNISYLGGDFCNRSPNMDNLKITSSLDLNGDKKADIIFLGVEEDNDGKKFLLGSAYVISDDLRISYFEGATSFGPDFNLFATPDDILVSKKN
ncbi:hypothetical protein [Halobacteriovorax sp.]|uniref:hypothetical protein n=1 Tax=Halobacteriovorax sp. TaxID=2020862 RepID=UPI003AF2307B